MADSACCKVDRTIGQHDLRPPGDEFGTLDEYLVAQWTGEAGGDATGYKELTRWFNRRLLRRVYERAGRSTLGTRLESEHEALTGDDELLRGEVADDLAADGIDADQLTDEMVSWSTMRRHLKECLGAEKGQPDSDSEWEVDSVDIARGQLETKTADALRSLETKDRLPEATRAEIDVQIKLSCPECPTRVPLEDALNRGYVCESHFEEGESGTVRLTDKLSLLVPLGLSALVSKASTYSYELAEILGTDPSVLAMDLGSGLVV